MTHPEEAGLMAAIRHEPDDMRLRLLMADWCEDNGRPDRADFIRYSVSHGNWHVVRLDGTLSYPDPSGSGGYLNCYVGRPYGMVVTFRHGFACEVVALWPEWMNHGPALAVHPLKSVRLHGKNPEASTPEARPFYGWQIAMNRSGVAIRTDGGRILPPELFGFLPSIDRAETINFAMTFGQGVRYESVEEAYGELSEAMIDLARGQWR